MPVKTILHKPLAKPAKILIADDDVTVRGLIRKYLKLRGYDPIECPNGRSALQTARTASPDLIILDAHLGDLSGLDVCAKLKQTEGTESIPILMISGTFKDEATRKHAIRLGARQYLHKPVDLDALGRAVRDALSGRPLKDAGPQNYIGTVLVADDDEQWLSLVKAWLESKEYRVVATNTERKILALAREERPDCIVLDYMLNGTTAAEVCESLQSYPDTKGIPVVVLTSHASEKFRVVYKGADHFVFKDGKPEELLAAVHASMRRRELDTGVLLKDDLKLDPGRNVVILRGKSEVELTSPQFALLYIMVQASPKPVSREELYKAVLPEVSDCRKSHSLEQLIQRLKQALGNYLELRIVTVKGVGWMYHPQPRA